MAWETMAASPVFFSRSIYNFFPALEIPFKKTDSCQTQGKGDMFELKRLREKQNKMSNAVTKRQKVKMPELSAIKC